MKHGRGFVVDPYHQFVCLPDMQHKLQLMFRTGLPEQHQLEPGWLSPVLDQGMTSSCEPHAFVGGIFARAMARGTPLGWVPSPAGIYRLARCIERMPFRTKLVDEGTTSPLCARAINAWGLKPMGPTVRDPGESHSRVSDCSILTINDEPNMVELMQDSENMMVGQYSCFGPGTAQTIENVRQALVNNIPVQIGGDVGGDYDEWTPEKGVYPGCDHDDPEKGGHGQLITGYRTAGTHIEFLVRNSWGSGWCDGGNVWVSQRMVLAADELTALDTRRVS